MASTDVAKVDRWFIGGGAVHTPESARRQTYASTGGAEGVGGAGDLLVRPWAVPGQGVRVAIGSGLALSRYVGGEAQTYMGTAYAEQIINTTPTGSSPSTGRSDLIVMRVKDPYAQGSPWPAPALEDRPAEQYVYFEAIPGVPTTTTRLQDVPGRQNDTGIALARIDFPANTGTVNASMIKDLRKVARPQREDVTFARPRVAADDSPQNYLTATVANGGEFFPGGGGYSNEFTVDVPTWATRVIFDAEWISVNYGPDRRPVGRYWLEFGDEYRPGTWPGKQQFEFATQQFPFNATRNDAGSTSNWPLADNRSVPVKLRGKKITVCFKAGVQNVPGANHTWMDALSGLKCRITFVESSATFEDAI
ncbi:MULTISPECIES: hypothetical protein [unclassified Leucobacter]|uniref:hypothetical protein n=1 Tax=unclassified Leucobacter TaxID=2621730 RepID=UPI00069C4882|nr:hypothetical protein [Leucobacter sp. Ag1]